MAGGGRVGGNGGPVKRAAWMFVAACIAVAIWGNVAKDPASVLPNLQNKSGEAESGVHRLIAKLRLSETGEAPKNVKVPVIVPTDLPTTKAPAPKK